MLGLVPHRSGVLSSVGLDQGWIRCRHRPNSSNKHPFHTDVRSGGSFLPLLLTATSGAEGSFLVSLQACTQSASSATGLEPHRVPTAIAQNVFLTLFRIYIRRWDSHELEIKNVLHESLRRLLAGKMWMQSETGIWCRPNNFMQQYEQNNGAFICRGQALECATMHRRLYHQRSRHRKGEQLRDHQVWRSRDGFVQAPWRYSPLRSTTICLARSSTPGPTTLIHDRGLLLQLLLLLGRTFPEQCVHLARLENESYLQAILRSPPAIQPLFLDGFRSNCKSGRVQAPVTTAVYGSGSRSEARAGRRLD